MATPRLGRAVAVFMVVTFGFTWLTSVPLVLAGPVTIMPWYFYLGSFGPAFGAIIATLVVRPAGGFKAWARHTLSFTATGRALLVVAASVTAYIAVGLLVEKVITGSLDRWQSVGLTSKLPGLGIAAVLLVWMLTGGLGEETGWRGWLMPALTQRFGSTVAALIVAGVWMLWHVPQFLFNPGFREMGWATSGWALALVAGSFWLGWLAQLGGWSILPVVVWHGGFDLLSSSDLGPSTLPATVSTIVMLQAASVIVVAVVRKRSRARSAREVTRETSSSTMTAQRTR